MEFKLNAPFNPTGDQPQAISKLVAGIKEKKDHQVLLGVTGSGKTFTVANIIQQTQLPTLVISHNKTLAAQLYQEFRDFFPDNAVCYFVSYYDYYQPEAYIPQTDTYIKKDADINVEIDKLRLSATAHLLTRPDVIVVASVSCIYNLGSPAEYGKHVLELIKGQLLDRETLQLCLVELQYVRDDFDFKRGSFRVRGDTVSIWPANQDVALRVEMVGDIIKDIRETDPLTGRVINQDENKLYFTIYPAKHHITPADTLAKGLEHIQDDLAARLVDLQKAGKKIAAYRLEQKVNYDLEQIREFGYVSGIENYSRYFDGRSPGQPPYTLLDYFSYNASKFKKGGFLTIVDESHATLPQVRGMYQGDKSRKQTLIDYGFRLPSALDNRPLVFSEFLKRVPQMVHTSATPGDWEVGKAGRLVVEQLIRPTGLLDPVIEVRPTKGQIQDLVREILIRKQKRERVLVTTLTKRMAESLTEYLNEADKLKKIVSVRYIHADVDTLERSEILTDLRQGKYDVVVGVNLLREGLDLPEVSLVAILDADKAGFLRTKTTLIQTMGRAARHEEGWVIMYADTVSGAMQEAMSEVERRRKVQEEYNQKHQITPQSIQKPIRSELIQRDPRFASSLSRVVQLSKKEAVNLDELDLDALTPADQKRFIRGLRRKMLQAARDFEFELAAKIRDKIEEIRKLK